MVASELSSQGNFMNQENDSNRDIQKWLWCRKHLK